MTAKVLAGPFPHEAHVIMIGQLSGPVHANGYSGELVHIRIRKEVPEIGSEIPVHWVYGWQVL